MPAPFERKAKTKGISGLCGKREHCKCAALSCLCPCHQEE